MPGLLNIIKPLIHNPIKLSTDILTNKVNAALEALMGQDKFFAFLKVEAAANTSVQEEAQQDKVKASRIAELEECKSKEDKRRLLNRWKAEEIARKQKERERAFEQYMEERPDQYPLFRQKSFLLPAFKFKPNVGKKERKRESF